MQRSIDRTTSRRPSRLIVHRSLNATTSRAISYYGSCHRYYPIIRDSAITRRYRSRYVTAAGDRSKHCRSVAPWPNRNQSYDPLIVRSGVTVALHYLNWNFYTNMLCLRVLNLLGVGNYNCLNVNEQSIISSQHCRL